MHSKYLSPQGWTLTPKHANENCQIYEVKKSDLFVNKSLIHFRHAPEMIITRPRLFVV